MNSIETFLLNTAKYGIWDIISVLVLFSSFIVAWRYFYFPRFRVNNLHFHVFHQRDNTNYPSKLWFEIRNYTGRSIVISNAYFKTKRLHADPKARGDTALKRYELKFNINFTDPDCLIKHSFKELTWFPVDPNQSDKEIQNILNKKTWIIFLKQAGTFNCKYTALTSKPKTYKLKRFY